MAKDVKPIKLVGGNHFGRYNKISSEETFNMIVSEGALVNYGGYEAVNVDLPLGVVGRGSIVSSFTNKLFVCIGSIIYEVLSDYGLLYVGTIGSEIGKVFFAEGNDDRIILCDGSKLYYFLNTGIGFAEVTAVTGVFVPVYVTYQSSRYIAVTDDGKWRLSSVDDPTITWPTGNIGKMNTVADKTQVVVPIPTRGASLFVIGRNSTEQWSIGNSPVFPYQKNISFSLGFGIANRDTIATLNDSIAWMGYNSNSGFSLFAFVNGQLEKISTEGIDYRLQNLQYPLECTGFMFRMNGHVFYQITWPKDNVTYFYDFASGEFFTATNHTLNYHDAQSIVQWNNKFIMLSLRYGSVYRFDDDIYTQDGQAVPQWRITPPYRQSDQNYFIVNYLSFMIESGEDNPITSADTPDMAIDLSISNDGGRTFSGTMRNYLPAQGIRTNKNIFWSLGMMNDCTFKLQFSGHSRFIIFDGQAEIRGL